MTVSDLIDDLKSRIDPAYATQIGTESYERRLCVEALEAQAAEIERLRAPRKKNGCRHTKTRKDQITGADICIDCGAGLFVTAPNNARPEARRTGA